MRLSSKLGYALLAIAATAMAAFAAVSGGERRGPAGSGDLLTVRSSGKIVLRTSAPGRPVITAPGLTPGSSVAGVITIANVGEHTTRLKLVPRRLTDLPGPNGGLLSKRLQLQLSRVRRKAPKAPRGAPIFAGPVARLHGLRLKPLRAGAKRAYHFRVAMLDGGPPESPTRGDNAFQGSAASVDFVWRGAPGR